MSKIVWLNLLLVGLVFGVMLVSCETPIPNQEGKLVGVNITSEIDIDPLIIKNMEFGGVVILELDDGSQVEAVVDKSMWNQLVGGMILEIEPTNDPDIMWRVIRIVETP